jgi:hypothetical protein
VPADTVYAVALITDAPYPRCLPHTSLWSMLAPCPTGGVRTRLWWFLALTTGAELVDVSPEGNSWSEFAQLRTRHEGAIRELRGISARETHTSLDTDHGRTHAEAAKAQAALVAQQRSLNLRADSHTFFTPMAQVPRSLATALTDRPVLLGPDARPLMRRHRLWPTTP